MIFKKLYYYALSILNLPDLAEEAVHDAFRIACGKPDSLMNSPVPEGWIMNTLKNVIRNKQRQLKLQRRLIEEDVSIEDHIASMGVEDDYSEFEFSDLISEEDYYLIKRVTLEQKTITETAEEFGISPEACKKRIQRAKKKLKFKLENM